MNNFSIMRRVLIFITFLIAYKIVNAQTGSISGVVIKENNTNSKSIEGIEIKIINTNFIQKLTADGKFNFTNIPVGNYELELNSTDFAISSGEIKVTQNSNSEVTFIAKNINENEKIVVVGYGSSSRRNSLGAISSVTGKDIVSTPTQSFEGALQGKATGVQVTVGSGMAGSAALIRIRGVASISASGDPLYIIDGIPISQDYFLNRNNGNNYGGGFNNNPLNSINPNDIENIEILKDAAATSIYGSRGANGVIIITTKRGSNKGFHFESNLSLGFGLPTKMPKMLNSTEWLTLYQEAWENDGNVGTPNLSAIGINMTWAEAHKYNTNWIKEVIGVGLKTNMSLQGTYGGKNYFIKGIIGYDNNSSYLIGNSYIRTSERLNIDWKPIKNLNIQLSHSLSNGLNNRVDAAWSGGLGAAMQDYLPIYPKDTFQNPNGSLKNIKTPLAFIRQLKNWRSLETRTINSVLANYSLAKNLIVTASFGYDYMDYNEHLYEPKALLAANNSSYIQNGNAKWWPTWTSNYNYYTTLQWFKDLNPKQKVAVLLGHEYQHSISGSKFEENQNALGPLDQFQADKTKNYVLTRKSPYEWAFISYFARANYSINNVFNVQITGRTDGSSRFGSNNRFGFFPSLSAGYVLSELPAIKKYRFISYAKIRAGVGRSGNANFDNYARWGAVKPSNQLQPNYNNDPRIEPSRLDNPNLRWEKTDNYDVGLDLNLFKNKIRTEIGAYYKNTRDVILSLGVPSYFGFKDYFDNVGRITNKGLEIAIKGDYTIKKKWFYNFSISASRNFNEIKSIGNYKEEAVSGGTNDTRVVVGHPVGTNFLVRFSHIDKNTGLPVYLDINGKETNKWDPVNRVAVGNVLPKVFGALNQGLRFKNWDLGINIYYSFGANIYESSAKRQMGVTTDWTADARVFDRWQAPGDEARYPRRTLKTSAYGSTTPWINTNQWLEDGSYIRLRSFIVGYNLSNRILQKYQIRNARIIITAINWLTWTKYTGIDPEIARDFENNADRNMSGNISYLTAPQEKSLTLGLNLSF